MNATATPIPADAQVIAGFETIPVHRRTRGGHGPDTEFVVRRGDAALVVESGESSIGKPCRVTSTFRAMNASGELSPYATRVVVAEFTAKRAGIDWAKAEVARAVAVEPGGKIVFPD